MDSNEAKAPSPGDSLAARISKPTLSTDSATAQPFQPKSGKLWSDDTDSPLSPLADKLSAQTLSATDMSADKDTNKTASTAEPPQPTPVNPDGATDKSSETPKDGASAPSHGSELHETDYDVQIKLADLQADPNNPLFSVKTFQELNLKEELLRGIIGMNFHSPSKVQEKTLPLLLKDPPTNLIGQSQSGTGKTAAFTLNILQRVDLSSPQAQSTPQAIVLAPTRELARQIASVIRLMGKTLEGLSVDVAIPAEKDARGRVISAPVIVGTPGTVQDVIRRRQLDPRGVKILVLDEADNMLDLGGLSDQCQRVRGMLNKDIQCVLFSATFPTEVICFANRFAPGANEMTLKHEELTVDGIKQIYLDCKDDQAKFNTLIKFYGLLTIGSSIIFTREVATSLMKRMTEEGHQVVYLTGELDGTTRDSTIDSFRSGEAKVLITTNVLARGIDVQSVSMVINYDVPTTLQPGSRSFVPDPQTYLHRIGRTGRFGRVGVAVTFVGDRRDWENLMFIQRYFQADMTQVQTDDWDELETTVTKIIKSTRAGQNFKDGAKMQF